MEAACQPCCVLFDALDEGTAAFLVPHKEKMQEYNQNMKDFLKVMQNKQLAEENFK